jgi:DNA invertase Pin-like site-specific DNA recombinase
VERLSPTERALELVGRWVESPAEDDQEYEARKRKALQAVRELGHHQLSEAIRRGMAEARGRGVHVGRPRKLAGTEKRARALVARIGVTAAAEVLGVSRRTLSRMLHRSKGCLVSHLRRAAPGAEGSLPSPVHAEP